MKDLYLEKALEIHEYRSNLSIEYIIDYMKQWDKNTKKLRTYIEETRTKKAESKKNVSNKFRTPYMQ